MLRGVWINAEAGMLKKVH